MDGLWKWLMLAGGVLIFLGGLFWLFNKIGIPFGKLPGDISTTGENFSFYFPIVTSVVLSVLLTIILNLIIYFFRK